MVLNTTEKGPIDKKKDKEFDPERQIQTTKTFSI
jgi:hypothetical protein